MNEWINDDDDDDDIFSFFNSQEVRGSLIISFLLKGREVKLVQSLIWFHITILGNKVSFVPPPNINSYVAII